MKVIYGITSTLAGIGFISALIGCSALANVCEDGGLAIALGMIAFGVVTVGTFMYVDAYVEWKKAESLRLRRHIERLASCQRR